MAASSDSRSSGRLVYVDADAEDDGRPAGMLQQDAGQLVVVDEDVVRPLELSDHAGRDLDAAGDRERGQQREQGEDVNRWEQDGGEQEGGLTGRDPGATVAPPTLELKI